MNNKDWNIAERISDVVKEKQLINLLLNYEDAQVEFIPKIEEILFFNDSNLSLFKYIKEMFLEKKTISRANLASSINQKAASGSIKILMENLRDVVNNPPSDNAENIIKDLIIAYKSRIVYKEVFLDSQKQFFNNDPIDDLVEKIGKTLFKLDGGFKKKMTQDIALETIDEIFNPKPEDAGLHIGLPEFDKVYGGVKSDTYITIAAESGAGKTAYVVDLIYRLCSQHADKVAVCFFSMEMSETRIMKRLFSRHASINTIKFSAEKVSGLKDDQKEKLYKAANDIRSWPLEIIYETMDIHKLKMKARQFVLQNPGKKHIFFVDHIGKIESGGLDMRVNTIKNSQGLKSLCIDHKSTVFVLSQLLKELAGPKYRASYHRPDESFIMESGAIKADSDILLMLWRPSSRFDTIAYMGNDNWDTKNKIIVMNEKNRDGIEKTDMVFGCDIGCSHIKDLSTPF